MTNRTLRPHARDDARLTVRPDSSHRLVIKAPGSDHTMVTLFPDGRVEVAEWLTEDQAALGFWRAVERMGFKLTRSPHD